MEHSSPSGKNTGNRATNSRLFAGVAVLVALPTYLALGARWWWGFDLATHFCAFYLLALLPIAVFLSLSKRWLLLALVSVALAINGSRLAPLYFRENATQDAPSLRIASINVLYGNSQYERVLDFIRQESPDLVLLIEVNKRWLPAVATLKSRFPYSLVKIRAGSSGIALFSKSPLEDLEILYLGSAGVPSIRATVRLDGTPVKIIGTHFKSPVSSERTRLRNEQLIATAHELARMSRPCLLVGDLNITPWSPYFRDLLQIGKLRNSQIGFGIQPSWLAAIPIDHLLHSADISILDRRIGPDVGSDHRPLIVDIAVKK